MNPAMNGALFLVIVIAACDLVNALESEICPIIIRNTSFSCAGGKLERVGEIDYALHLPNITALNVSHNRIGALYGGEFERLSQLVTLDLSFNQLRHLYLDVFRGLRKLTHLNLSGNPIATIGKNTFADLNELSYLDLSFTTIICDCDLAWFHDWVLEQNAVRKRNLVISEGSVCFTPSAVKGKKLKELTAENLKDCASKVTLPFFEISPSENQVVSIGDSISLHCSVTLISPRPVLEWYHDGQTVSSPSITITESQETGSITSMLTIPSVSEKHDGSWKCQVSNVRVDQQASRLIHVLGKKTECPEIVTQTSRGDYRWPRTLPKDVSINLPCEGNSNEAAFHTCGKDGNWKGLDVSRCAFTQEFEKVLNEYSQAPVIPVKVEETVTYLNTYLNNTNQSIYSVEQLDLVLKALEGFISRADPSTDFEKLATSLLWSVNWLLDTPVAVFRDSSSIRPAARVASLLQRIAVMYSTDVSITMRNFALFYVSQAPQSSGYRCEAKRNTSATYLSCYPSESIGSLKTNSEGVLFIPPVVSGSVSVRRSVVVSFSNLKIFTAVLPDGQVPSSFALGVFPVSAVSSGVETLSLELAVPRLSARPKIASLSADLAVQPDVCSVQSVDMDVSSVKIVCSRFGLMLAHHRRAVLLALQTGNAALSMNLSIYASVGIAVVCHLILLFVYAISFATVSAARKWVHCLLNLWSSFTVLAGIFVVAFSMTAEKRLCEAIGVTMHYLMLGVLIWSCLTGHFVYSSLRNNSKNNETDVPSKKRASLYWIYLFGWGTPVLITGISVALNRQAYGNQNFCFLSSTSSLASVFAPATVALIIFAVYLVLIFCRNSKSDQEAIVGFLQPESQKASVSGRPKCVAVLVLVYLISFSALVLSVGFWTFTSGPSFEELHSAAETSLIVLFIFHGCFAVGSFLLIWSRCWNRSTKSRTNEILMDAPYNSDARSVLQSQSGFAAPSSFQISSVVQTAVTTASISTNDELFETKHYNTSITASETNPGFSNYGMRSSGRSRNGDSEVGTHRNDGRFAGFYDIPKTPNMVLERMSARSSQPSYGSDSAKFETKM